MAKASPLKTKTRVPRSSRSRADVQEEFADVAREVAAKEPREPKAAEIEEAQQAEIRKSVEDLSVDKVVQKITAVGLETSRALQRISEQLVEEVQELERVREAAQLERAEIERLHKIDVAATALDLLVAEYAARKQQLETERVAKTAAWAEQDRECEAARKEQEEVLRKAREREAEEYEYKKAQERKKAQDKFDEQMQKLEKQNREKQETLEKGWQQRETTLRAAEEELAGLRAQVADFPARLQREIDAAVTQAVETARREHDTQLQLLRKDVDGDTRVAQLQVKAFEDTVAKQAAQIAELQAQVAEAKRQVQEIAVKALDSAAGAKTLEEVRQIAREQAKREGR